eukprot:42039-Eustigmatos_ZCMA.PRE.1
MGVSIDYPNQGYRTSAPIRHTPASQARPQRTLQLALQRVGHECTNHAAFAHKCNLSTRSSE